MFCLGQDIRPPCAGLPVLPGEGIVLAHGEQHLKQTQAKGGQRFLKYFIRLKESKSHHPQRKQTTEGDVKLETLNPKKSHPFPVLLF